MAREPAEVAELRRALGASLAAWRTKAGLTQLELGDATFFDRTRLSRLENGQGNADEDFWRNADEQCNAGGELLAMFQMFCAVKLQHEQDARAVEVATALAKADELRESAALRLGHHLTSAPQPAVAGDYASKIEFDDTPERFLAQTRVETPVPTEVGWVDVRHVQASTRAIALSENMFGGGVKCESALAELRWAQRQLDARATNDVRRAMYEAVGNLGSVVAYSAFDIASYEAADRCFAFTLWCAEKAGSWALRANTLAEMARKAEYLGDYELALTQIEFAKVRADRLSPTARAMLWTLRARMLALTGRFAEAIDDVKRADEHFAARDPNDEPPWLCYYDAAEHQGSTGKALIPVAETEKQLELAAPRLEYAVHSQRESYPRSRAFSRTRLASLMMAVGDPHEAVAIGRQAYVEAQPLQSFRIVKELRKLATVSQQHSRIDDVTDLANDIAKMTPPSTEPT